MEFVVLPNFRVVCRIRDFVDKFPDPGNRKPIVKRFDIMKSSIKFIIFILLGLKTISCQGQHGGKKDQNSNHLSGTSDKVRDSARKILFGFLPDWSWQKDVPCYGSH